jgi:hypothetical protein
MKISLGKATFVFIGAAAFVLMAAVLVWKNLRFTTCAEVQYYTPQVCPTGWRDQYNSNGCVIGLQCPGNPSLDFSKQKQ